ncbi:CrcB family protein [Microbacterium lacus]|uniref:fluoride efflux transporter FluC n=1 Tax=Microbacterium lacus TaxID=415217 RepID=UPI00384CC814
MLLIMIGGGTGAALRFIVDGLILSRTRSGFPWGTMVINVTGSLISGFLAGLAGASLLGAEAWLILSVGLMGGFTTFSTAMVDTVRMAEGREWRRFAINAFGMLVLAVAAALAGLAIARAL